jgi:hypothetical protein
MRYNRVDRTEISFKDRQVFEHVGEYKPENHESPNKTSTFCKS